ncbi:hypothetical protein AADQ46_005302 [Enterobacter soli]
MEGISSVDTDEILQALQEDIRNSKTFKVLNGECFIKNAYISDGIVSANYGVKMDLAHRGKLNVTGMLFCADRFNAHEAAQSTIENAVVSNMKVKTSLSDEMKQAIIDAVRESDMFTSLQTAIAAQEASILGLQQTMVDAVHDAIRNALKPGGLLYCR